MSEYFPLAKPVFEQFFLKLRRQVILQSHGKFLQIPRPAFVRVFAGVYFSQFFGRGFLFSPVSNVPRYFSVDPLV
jgi:hypothetical protein